MVVLARRRLPDGSQPPRGSDGRRTFVHVVGRTDQFEVQSRWLSIFHRTPWFECEGERRRPRRRGSVSCARAGRSTPGRGARATPPIQGTTCRQTKAGAGTPIRRASETTSAMPNPGSTNRWPNRLDVHPAHHERVVHPGGPDVPGELRPDHPAVSQVDRAEIAVALPPQHLVGFGDGPHGDDGDAEVLEAVHGLRPLVAHFCPEERCRGDRGLGHGVGEDGVHVPLAGQPVCGFGHVSGRHDPRHRRGEAVVDVDRPNRWRCPSPATNSTWGFTPVAATTRSAVSTVPSASRTPVTDGVPTKASACTPSRRVTPRRLRAASATLRGDRVQDPRHDPVAAPDHRHVHAEVGQQQGKLDADEPVARRSARSLPRRCARVPTSSSAVRRDLKSRTPGGRPPRGEHAGDCPMPRPGPRRRCAARRPGRPRGCPCRCPTTCAPRRSSIPRRSATSRPFQYSVESRPVR